MSDSRDELRTVDDGAWGDDLLGRLLAEYMDRVNRGEALDEDEIARDHPDLAGELIENLRLLTRIGPFEELEVPLGTLGDYTLRREIGRGGMGVVYDAKQNSMDRRVALKVLPAALAVDRQACARFLREAQTAGQLSHPNVVAVHAMGVDDKIPYYAMEFVEGETLADLLARRREGQSELPFGDPDTDQSYYLHVAKAFADVAGGLQHAHSRGVIHRDIKPSNLILEGGSRLRILDFGLARLEGQEGLTLTGDFVGTPLYMSPEQARRRKVTIDSRTDIYSLGATMYEMLTWRPPFRGRDHEDTLSQIIEREPRPPRQLNARVPVDLETILLKCLRKDPGDRYGSAEALEQDLRRFVRGDAIEARPQSVLERGLARARRHKAKTAVAALFLTLLFSLAWFVHRSERAEYQAALERYRPAVEAVLPRIYAGQFSLKAIEGDYGRVFRHTTWMPLVLPGDFETVSGRREGSAFESAVSRLAEVASALLEARDAHYHLARAYEVLGRMEDADRELERALECDPEFVPARVLRGDPWTEPASGWQRSWLRAHVSVAQGKWSEAEVAYDDLIGLKMDGKPEPYIGCFVEAHLGRGVARLEMKKYVKAQQDLLIAGDDAPGLEPALLLGKAYYLGDQREEAEATFKELYERARPEDRNETALWIAAAYDALADGDRGREWTQRLRGTPIEARLDAAFLHRQSRTTEAIAAARRAINSNPGDPITRLVLAASLWTDLWSGPGADRPRKLPELVRAARSAVELFPESNFAQLLRDWAETEMNHEAYRFLRRKAMRHSRTLGMIWTALVALGAGGVGQAQEGFFGDERAIPTLSRPASGGVNQELHPNISADGLTIYFDDWTGSTTSRDLYMATRATTSEPFGDRVKLGKPNGAFNDTNPSISTDGLELYFMSDRPDGEGGLNLYVARREDSQDSWADPDPLEELNTEFFEGNPSVSFDGLELYFASDRSRGMGADRDLYVARRENLQGSWSDPRPVLDVNTFRDESNPSVSSDSLTIFWSLDAGVGVIGDGIWMARRDTTEDEFENPVRVNLFGHVRQADISKDWPAPDSKIYFPRGWDIHEATWFPDCNGNFVDDREEIAEGTLEDLNGNGKADICDGEAVARFRRGDANIDGAVNIADGVATLGFLFAGGGTLSCLDAADTDDSGQLDIADAIATFNYLFVGAAAPSAPGPEACGGDPTEDALGCDAPSC